MLPQSEGAGRSGDPEVALAPEREVPAVGVWPSAPPVEAAPVVSGEPLVVAAPEVGAPSSGVWLVPGGAPVLAELLRLGLFP